MQNQSQTVPSDGYPIPTPAMEGRRHVYCCGHCDECPIFQAHYSDHNNIERGIHLTFSVFKHCPGCPKCFFGPDGKYKGSTIAQMASYRAGFRDFLYQQ